jgi:thiamine kinase-like enzyme
MIDALNVFQKIGTDYLDTYKDFRQEELARYESPDVASSIIDVKKKVKTENDNLIFQEIVSLYEDLCSEYATFAKEKYTMAHSDFILFNLILDESGVAAINDFDNVKVLPRIHDMAEFLVSATLLNYIAPTTNLKLPIQVNPEKVLLAYILERYVSDFKLSNIEKQLLGTITEIIWLWSLVLAVFKDDYSLSELKPVINTLNKRGVKNLIDRFCL